MDLFDSVCITSVMPTLLRACGIEPGSTEKENSILLSLIKNKLGGEKPDRIVMYNPDAVALWMYQKYTDMFEDAVLSSDIGLPMLSVMPSVTPVCFASMYTGVMPDVHGIKKYEKPVLRQNTVFDEFIKAGRKCAIVSTSGDSISKIFLERNMDYFIYDTLEEVNAKAFEVLDEDKYDLVVIYNGNYDGNMHKCGPEGENAFSALKDNIETYRKIVEKIKKDYRSHNTVYAFAPDHGCHEIDGGCGSHGLEMEEDMNVIHFYGAVKKSI